VYVHGPSPRYWFAVIVNFTAAAEELVILK
jgi:hypothetical protein